MAKKSNADISFSEPIKVESAPLVQSDAIPLNHIGLMQEGKNGMVTVHHSMRAHYESTGKFIIVEGQQKKTKLTQPTAVVAQSPVEVVNPNFNIDEQEAN
jgi:hypothetical protein